MCCRSMRLVWPIVEALRQVDGWPCEHVAVCVAGTVEATRGDESRRFEWASVTKLASALVEERSEMSFEAYFAHVWQGTTLELRGSAGSGASGTLADLSALAHELQRPVRVADETLAEATTVQFPGLVGVVPGFGRQDPNDWGLGFELRDGKSPHWTGAGNAPETFGHFGRSGTFLWVDPVAGIALGALTDRPFGDWAIDAWPRLADAVLAEAAVSRGQTQGRG